ncbi:MAG: MBL fold metallo-hydrolase [Chloroflexi bacterium]|nr:MBL fold metallo-hydrolase [Chloroflexota bacterium]
MVVGALVVGPFASNCYIVGSRATKEGLIIDPGAEAEAIIQEVTKLGLTIKTIVATHGHIDHVGAVGPIKEATGAIFAMHADDIEIMTGHSRRGSMFSSSWPSPPTPDLRLAEGDAINIGDLHFTVIHTPGHTPGGICLLGDGLIFTGDTLFQSSIGRYDMPGGDGALLVENIQSKLMVLSDDTLVLPGHGPETTIGQERQWNPFLQNII